MDDSVVVCENLHFSYRLGKEVLSDISLKVLPGDKIALLAPNGSGKTTLIKLLCGVLKPTSGKVLLLGGDPFHDKKKRNSAGVMHQNYGFEEMISVKDNLKIFAGFKGLSRKNFDLHIEKFADLLEGISLDVLPMMLSGGQRKRLQLFRTLMGNPNVLFLDEPTVGMDIEARDRVFQILENYRKETDCTFFWVSHYLKELEDNCNRFIFLSKGTVRKEMTGPELTSSKNSYIEIVTERKDILLETIPDLFEAGESLQYHRSINEFFTRILPEVYKMNIGDIDIQVKSSTLEDVYRKVLGDLS